MASSDTGSLTADNDGSKQTPDAASGSRYRFRSDLEIVRPREADSNVTIVDARSGERHVFTADEFFVCQAADGSSTLAAIRQAFNAETGRDFPHGKLFAFFRRLRGLGLLEENMVDKSDLAAPVADVPAPAPAATKSMAAGQVQEPQDPVAEQVDQANEHQDLENPESGGTSGSSKTGSNRTQRGVRRGLRHAARGEVDGGPGSGNRTRSRAPTGSTDPVELRLSNRAFSRSAETGAAMPEGDFEGVGLSSEALQNFRARIARRDAEDAAANEPARLSFFDPNFIFSILAAVTWPLKYLVLPLLLVAVVIPWLLYDQRELLRQDIKAFDASVVSVIILGLVIANFTSRLAQGTLIRSFGSEVRAFGIALSFGVPRFFVDLGGIATLDRRGQLWAYSAPLMWRLVLFCAGTLLWFMLRGSAPAPSHLALVVGQIGLVAFLLSAWPLLPSDGYRWLVTYFARPTLRADTGRCDRQLGLEVRGRQRDGDGQTFACRLLSVGRRARRCSGRACRASLLRYRNNGPGWPASADSSSWRLSLRSRRGPSRFGTMHAAGKLKRLVLTTHWRRTGVGPIKPMLPPRGQPVLAMSAKCFGPSSPQRCWL